MTASGEGTYNPRIIGDGRLANQSILTAVVYYMHAPSVADDFAKLQQQA